MASIWLSKLKLPLTLVVLQVVFVILFAVFVDYDSSASPAFIKSSNSTGNEGTSATGAGKAMIHNFYPMFQDVHVMIFIGFGFLMMFLRRYGFSSVGLNMLLACLCIQWATLISGICHNKGNKFTISVQNMLTADFASATVLITFGALLGKTNPLQMVLIIMLEVVFYAINEYIGVVLLQAVDIGGSMFVHCFGAYFGLAVSRILYNPDVHKSEKEGSVYQSDMFAMIGTIFLWLFWPSFNSALAVDDAQSRAVLNTYFALAACCVVTFTVSSLVDKNGKFDMVHIQNATLAGGVAVGTSADMMIQPYGALIIGSLAAVLSVLGYKYITPFLLCKFKIHDTCGVNNLHGMPALLAGITGAIVVSMVDKEIYGYTLYRQFPAMAPNNSSLEILVQEGFVDIKPGKGRTAGEQASHQIIALAVTLAFAIVGGLLVGLVVKFCSFLGQPSGELLFEDSPSWHMPEDPQDSNTTLLISRVISELDKRQMPSTTMKADDSDLPLLEYRDNELHLEDKNHDHQGQ